MAKMWKRIREIISHRRLWQLYLMVVVLFPSHLVGLAENQPSTEPLNKSSESSLDVDELFAKGQSYLQKSNLREALLCFDQAIRLKPDCAKYYEYKAWCLYLQGSFLKALNQYGKAKELDPLEANYKLSAAMCFSRLGNTSEAKREFIAASKMCKEDSALRHFCLAEMYSQKNDFRNAVRECDKALASDPTSDDILELKVSSLASMRKYSQAKDVVTAVLKDSPGNLTFLTWRVNLEMRQSSYQDALTHLQEAIKLDPEFANAYVWMGYYCEHAGKDQEALEYYKKATQLGGGNPNLDETMCLLLVRQNRLHEAVPYAIASTQQSTDTEFIRDEVTKSFLTLPDEVQKALLNSGIRITIAPTVTDSLPELENTHPRGYESTDTWRKVPAYYTGQEGPKSIVIAEKFETSAGQMALNENAFFSTLHELGHAYDYCKGQISYASRFKKCYLRDCKQLTDAARRRNEYFLQRGYFGRHECFASLFEFNYCQQARLKIRRPRLADDFPNCYELLKSVCPRIPHAEDDIPTQQIPRLS
jgi:tetratricopeptide (TPR) repeat protein